MTHAGHRWIIIPMSSSDIHDLWSWWTTLPAKVDRVGALSSINIKVVALVMTTSMCYGELTSLPTTFSILNPQASGYQLLVSCWVSTCGSCVTFFF